MAGGDMACWQRGLMDYDTRSAGPAAGGPAERAGDRDEAGWRTVEQVKPVRDGGVMVAADRPLAAGGESSGKANSPVAALFRSWHPFE
jgi:hypothetical protein